MAHAGDFEDAPLLLHAEAVGPSSPGPAAAAPPPTAGQAQWASGGNAKAEPGGALRVEARSGSAAAALHAAATGMPWGVTAGEGPTGHCRPLPVSFQSPIQTTADNRLLLRHAGLLLTDMVGIGALAMPSVFARLGWLVSGSCDAAVHAATCILASSICLDSHPTKSCNLQISLLLLLLLSLGYGYLGVLFSRLAVAVPTAETMDQLGEAAGGKWGKRAVYAVFYTSVVADPVALHITCLLALQQVWFQYKCARYRVDRPYTGLDLHDGCCSALCKSISWYTDPCRWCRACLP